MYLFDCNQVGRLGGTIICFHGAYTIFAQNWQDLVMALVKNNPSGECQWSVLYCLRIVKVNIFLFLLM